MTFTDNSETVIQKDFDGEFITFQLGYICFLCISETRIQNVKKRKELFKQKKQAFTILNDSMRAFLSTRFNKLTVANKKKLNSLIELLFSSMLSVDDLLQEHIAQFIMTFFNLSNEINRYILLMIGSICYRTWSIGSATRSIEKILNIYLRLATDDQENNALKRKVFIHYVVPLCQLEQSEYVYPTISELLKEEFKSDAQLIEEFIEVLVALWPISLSGKKVHFVRLLIVAIKLLDVHQQRRAYELALEQLMQCLRAENHVITYTTLIALQNDLTFDTRYKEKINTLIERFLLSHWSTSIRLKSKELQRKIY